MSTESPGALIAVSLAGPLMRVAPLSNGMLQVEGWASGTALTGTLYEPDDAVPRFSGAPDGDAPFVWLCDEFYAVESGGQVQRVGDRAVNVAFESPLPRGFESRRAALAGAREHLRTQFARIGVDPTAVDVRVRRA
jgi:hypothetical protein